MFKDSVTSRYSWKSCGWRAHNEKCRVGCARRDWKQ